MFRKLYILLYIGYRYISVAADSRLVLQYREVPRGNEQEGAMQSVSRFQLGTNWGPKPDADGKDEEGIP